MIQRRTHLSRFHPTALATAATAAFFAAVPGLAAQAPGDPLGPEGFSTASSTPTQQQPAVAMDADGDLVIAATGYGDDSDGDDAGILLFKVDAFGRFLGPGNVVDPAGTPTFANKATIGRQKAPAIAMDAAGDFVVAWESGDPGQNYYQIFLRRFSASFEPVGREIQVTTRLPSKAVANRMTPTVAMDDDGDFVVAWSDALSAYSIVGQRFNSSGKKAGREFHVASSTGFNRLGPRAAMDADGDFVVTWASLNQDLFGYGIYARRFKANGAARGPEFLVNTRTEGSQVGPAVAMDANGNFVIAFNESPENGGLFIDAQRFDATGAKAGGEFQVEEVLGGGFEFSPTVALSKTGEFAIAWTDEVDGEGEGNIDGVVARRFGADGTALGASFRVNTTTLGQQSAPALAMDADSDFAVAFVSSSGNATIGGPAVLFQRYTGGEDIDLAESLVGVNETFPPVDSDVDYSYRLDNQHAPSAIPGVGEATGISVIVDLGVATLNGISGTGWSCSAVTIVQGGNRTTCTDSLPLEAAANTQFVLSTRAPSEPQAVFTTFTVSDNQADDNTDNNFLVTSVSVVTPDTTPNAFRFPARTGVATNTSIRSAVRTIAGINVKTGISIANGQYSINGAAFRSMASTVDNGDKIRVRQRSSANPSTTTTATLQVGTRAVGFKVTTADDHTPDAFSFAAQANVPLGATRLSEAITVSGINVATPISVVNGAYRIDAGGFTSSAGTVTAGDTVVVQQVSADTPSTSKTTTLTIGDVSAPFTTTTQVRDDIVNPFTFASQASVPVNSLRTSGAIVVSGINVPVPVTVTNGEYSLDNADFTTAAGTAKGGDQIRVRHTSAARPDTTVKTTLHLGSVDGTFRSTTVAADATPDAFAFVDQSGATPGAVVTSGAITVSGINVAVPVSVSGGSYHVNGGAFTTAAGMVGNGDMVQVRATAAAAGGTVNVTLTVGGVSDTFTVTSAK